jgi:hypothetical protein
MGKRALIAAALAVVLACCGGLGGLAVIAVQRAREAANAAGCKNNLRQLALGAQNHHEQRGDNVPLGTFSGGVSWSVLMVTYTDHSCLSRRERWDLPYNASPENVRALHDPRASLAFLHCPSRRHPAEYTDAYPLSDYAVPSLGVDKTLDDPQLDDTWMQCHDLDKNHGPLLLLYARPPPMWNEQIARHYRSQTSEASFLGGTSHQILFGEKALHPGSLGRGGKAGDFTVCSFIENSYNASGAARPANGGISPSPYDHPDTVYRYWGSWHPGICQFAFADGSHRPLNNAISASVLAQLCDRTDANKTGIPLN